MTTTTDGSDVDSFVEKRRRKRTDDEGLLFREAAYGAAGSGLPGLFSGEEYDNDGDSMIAKNHRESLTAPIWVSSLRYPSSNKDKSITCRSRAAASSTLSSHLPPPRIPSWDSSLPKHPKPSLSSHKYCYHPNDENDDSSSITISGSDTDCTSRAGSSVYDNEADTLSVADVYDALEKEVVGQLDIKLAMRLRREMERRERSTRSSAARRKPLGIQVK